MIFADAFEARSSWHRNRDEVLIGRQCAAPARELFHHRGRKVLTGIYHRRCRVVPAARHDCRTARIIDRKFASRIAYTVANERSIQPLRLKALAHTAIPYLMPPSIFSTARTPISDS